jgi:sulfite reductase (NADPH) hemoprotein beta-component
MAHPPATRPQMLTANNLRRGEVLYWKGGDWVAELDQGDIFTDPKTADAALAEAQAFVAGNKVVAPYLFEVTQQDGKIRPVKEREIIRSLGPSVRPDTGKQASNG